MHFESSEIDYEKFERRNKIFKSLEFWSIFFAVEISSPTFFQFRASYAAVNPNMEKLTKFTFLQPMNSNSWPKNTSRLDATFVFIKLKAHSGVFVIHRKSKKIFTNCETQVENVDKLTNLRPVLITLMVLPLVGFNLRAVNTQHSNPFV